LKKKKPKYVHAIWDINGTSFPVRLYKEWRANRRVSIGKNAIIVRIPMISSLLHKKEHEIWAKKWLEQQLINNSAVFSHFKLQEYRDGHELRTTKKSYTLHLSKGKQKTASAKCIENDIVFKIPQNISQQSEHKVIHTLLGRILAQDNIALIKSRVKWFNDHYFQCEIKSVRLKNNKSNWGSCSSTGNINISVRLLFAPDDVQDYILIHELAHLKELNHTSKFWKIVENVMPEYRKRERWLKENNHLCNF